MVVVLNHHFYLKLTPEAPQPTTINCTHIGWNLSASVKYISIKQFIIFIRMWRYNNDGRVLLYYPAMLNTHKHTDLLLLFLVIYIDVPTHTHTHTYSLIHFLFTSFSLSHTSPADTQSHHLPPHHIPFTNTLPHFSSPQFTHIHGSPRLFPLRSIIFHCNSFPHNCRFLLWVPYNVSTTLTTITHQGLDTLTGG